MVETALHTPYCFSFMRRGKATAPAAAPGTGQPASEKDCDEAVSTTQQPTKEQPQQEGSNPYESSIRTIATVSTVESFWEIYNYLKRPSDLPTTTDYHFFRGGIKPTWEDPSNAKGGKWIVRLPKGLASRYWEEMILALIGGQLSPTGAIPDGEICGAVLSVRYAEDILGVWNRTAADREMVERIRDAIKKCLQLPAQANMEYKPHQTSLADRSSFRNTQVWKPKSLEGRSMSMGEPMPSTGGPSPTAAGGAPVGLMSATGVPPAPPGGSTRRSTLGPSDLKLKRGESGGGRWRNPN
ncbi:hypothetical protein ACA910_010696 [Epithemia clementina (nom. ined.)]